MRPFLIPCALFLAAFMPEAEDVTGLTLVRSKADGAREDAISTVHDLVRNGRSAIRFTITSGDCVPEDCARERERVELKSRETDSEGMRATYRWSFYLPSDFKSVWPAREFIAQFHQEGGHPAFLFSLQPEGLVFENRFVDRETNAVLVPETTLRGRWHDVEVQVDWSRSSGAVKVVVNGVEMVHDQGQTLSEPEAYFKIGLYRAHILRFGAALPAQSMTVDGISREVR